MAYHVISVLKDALFQVLTGGVREMTIMEEIAKCEANVNI